MKTLIAAFIILIGINASADGLRYCALRPPVPHVNVLYHGKFVKAIKAEVSPTGWVVVSAAPRSCVVDYVTLTDVTEGYGPVATKTVACGLYKIYLSDEKFVSGHLYEDSFGRLIYLSPRT